MYDHGVAGHSVGPRGGFIQAKSGFCFMVTIHIHIYIYTHTYMYICIHCRAGGMLDFGSQRPFHSLTFLLLFLGSLSDFITGAAHLRLSGQVRL